MKTTHFVLRIFPSMIWNARAKRQGRKKQYPDRREKKAGCWKGFHLPHQPTQQCFARPQSDSPSLGDISLTACIRGCPKDILLGFRLTIHLAPFAAHSPCSMFRRPPQIITVYTTFPLAHLAAAAAAHSTPHHREGAGIVRLPLVNATCS